MEIKKVSHGDLLGSLQEAANQGAMTWVIMSTAEKNSVVLNQAKNKKLWLNLEDFVKKTGEKFEVEPTPDFISALSDAKVIVGNASNAISVFTEFVPAQTKWIVFMEVTRPRDQERAVHFSKRMGSAFKDVNLNLIDDTEKGGTHETN